MLWNGTIHFILNQREKIKFYTNVFLENVCPEKIIDIEHKNWAEKITEPKQFHSRATMYGQLHTL